MARGRMISKSLGTSRKFAALSGPLAEFSAARYPLINSHTDDFGRLEGDSFTIKHRVWPTAHRDEAEFQGALEQLRSVGLIKLYLVGEQQYVAVVGFDDHQTGLHKRTQSKLPAPNETELPLVSHVDKSSRAGDFLSKYNELYRDVIKQPYMGNSRAQKMRDFEAAQELCAAYADEDLLTITEFFLRVDPSKNTKARMLAGKQRTVPMLKTLVGDIATHLKIEARL